MPTVTGTDDWRPLSDRLRVELLKELGREKLSISALARELGYDRSNVARWLREETAPSSGLLDAAEAYLAKHDLRLSRNKP